MKTGLTEQEKEMLLKQILISCSIIEEYTAADNNYAIILNPLVEGIRFERFTLEAGKLVIKAMNNLRNSMEMDGDIK